MKSRIRKNKLLALKHSNITTSILDLMTDAINPEKAGELLLYLIHIKYFYYAAKLLRKYPSIPKNCLMEDTNNTALHCALKTTHPDLDLVSLLCQNNDAISKENADNNTALYVAASRGQHRVVSLFIRNYLSQFSSIQLAKVLCVLIRTKQYDLAKELLKKDNHLSKIYPVNDSADRALHIIARESFPDMELFELLCENNSELNIENKQQQTFFSIAASKNHNTIIKICLDKYLDKFTDTQLKIVLLNLINEKQFDHAKTLLKKRPNLTSETALLALAQNKSYELVTMMLENGINKYIDSQLEPICTLLIQEKESHQNDYINVLHLLISKAPQLSRINTMVDILIKEKRLPDLDFLGSLCGKTDNRNIATKVIIAYIKQANSSEKVDAIMQKLELMKSEMAYFRIKRGTDDRVSNRWNIICKESEKRKNELSNSKQAIGGFISFFSPSKKVVHDSKYMMLDDNALESSKFIR